MSVIALSASYGARGGTIGPSLAGRLGVPFVDRVLSHRVAGALDVSVEEAHRAWEPEAVPFLERVLTSFGAVDVGTVMGPPPPDRSPADFRRAAEQAVLEQAATGEGVILGRGAVAALRARPHVLRVRLDGPPEARLMIARETSGLDLAAARATMRRLDRFHREYLREFHDVDVEDPGLYHLVLDSTALDPDVCVGIIETAARAIA